MHTYSYRLAEFYRKHKYTILLAGLVLTGFFLRLYVSFKEPFLHEWDERFHALVARNLIDHPLTPMLRKNPVAGYDPFSWCCNHIWLHKQPLFMWQMAGSMKLFGVSELSMRLPSIIMGSIMILLVYRISFLLTRKEIVSLLAATFFCFSHFQLELISGIRGMDHNDVALGFYVLCSLWAYAEYDRSPKWYWILLIGIFSGCAILNKWLIGLFVFLCWGVALLFDIKKLSIKAVTHFVSALLVCCCVFIPWQIYILNKWSAEANYVYEFNRRHITEALQGHGGTVWYYKDKFSKILNAAWPFVFAGIFFSFRRPYRQRTILHASLFGLLFVFCFFSFVVKTKVQSHFFFVAPIFLLYISIGIVDLFSFVDKKYWTVPVFFLAAWLSLRPNDLKRYFNSDPYRARKIHNSTVYKNLNKVLPSRYKVVMNLPSFEDVELMFYQNDITAYHWCLSEQEIKALAKKRVPIAAFKNHGEYRLPEYLINYPDLFIIEKELQ